MKSQNPELLRLVCEYYDANMTAGELVDAIEDLFERRRHEGKK